MVSDVTVTKNSPGTISAYHSEVPSWARTFGAPKNVTSPNTVAIEIRYDHATREPRHDAYARIGNSTPATSSVVHSTTGMPRAIASTELTSDIAPSKTQSRCPTWRGASEVSNVAT